LTQIHVQLLTLSNAFCAWNPTNSNAYSTSGSYGDQSGGQGRISSSESNDSLSTVSKGVLLTTLGSLFLALSTFAGGTAICRVPVAVPGVITGLVLLR
jgi:hypothetical protein